MFSNEGGSKSNMCGSEQYYAVSSPTGKMCNIAWSVNPSDADYDLYVKWSSECPSTSSYDCSSTNSGSSAESCSSSDKVLSSYALVKKVSGSGTYSISVSVSDCVDANCRFCGDPTSNNCWRKVKDENCNDLSWYDFHDYGILGASPKCAVGASHASHYDYFGYGGAVIWCPETEAMWRNIRCGGGWPSGSEGDWCKVWWLDWTGWKSRQGYWDTDSNSCIIKCTSDRRESRESDARDFCSSSGAGDGKCEQACGADSSCDEKDTGDLCGTNGRCASYCLCCEASDSDNGINYTVKGTTSGYYQRSCESFTDTCVWELGKVYLQEYFISDRNVSSEFYDCSKRTDGLIRCVDGKCGCLYDSDCPANNSIKGKCDSSTHTCYWPPCARNDECVDNACCTADPRGPNPGGTGVCVGQGIYSNNPKWLCDPPEWNFGEVKPEAKVQNIFDLIFNFFSHFFQR